MKRSRLPGLVLLLVFNILVSPGMNAQQWHLEKEKDSIKVYTRPEPGSHFKAYKGDTEVSAPMDSIISMVEKVELFDEWDEDLEEIRILERHPGKSLKYYVVYRVPWPFQNRDLCVDAAFSSDPVTGSILLLSHAIPGAMPLADGVVRITNYWQQWTFEQKENGNIHITLEGFAEPAGEIPAWVANLAITDTPMNMLRAIRKKFQ